jgi:multidrug efflux pump
MRAFGKIVNISIDKYTHSLKKFMAKRWLAFPILLLMLGSIFVIGSQLKSELAPTEDKSSLRVISTAAEGTTYEAMDAYQVKLLHMMDTIPEKKFLLGVTSPTFRASTSVNSSFIFMPLKQPSEREKSQDDLANEINRELSKLTFAKSFVLQEETIKTSGGGRLPLQFVLQAPDLERLKTALPTFMDEVQKSPVFFLYRKLI